MVLLRVHLTDILKFGRAGGGGGLTVKPVKTKFKEK